jgi:benzoyl-CoA reductase/2-hydroxyglutaryl-CoA dehydratase subunit BcrC/BadD/HgdB
MALKPILAKLGVPSTDLELDTTLPVNQFRTQLEAFLEILKPVVPLE